MPLYLVARLLAFTIDIALVGFVVATFVFNTFEPGGLTVYSSHDAAAFGTVAAASFGAALAVAFLCEALFGTTLGKAIFALHVRRGDGGHAGVGRVFVRYLVRPLDLVGIGPVLALLTPRHQRLGDFAAGTVVARSRLGPLASLLGIAFVAGLLYVQYSFGGGARSAFGVRSGNGELRTGPHRAGCRAVRHRTRASGAELTVLRSYFSPQSGGRRMSRATLPRQP